MPGFMGAVSPCSEVHLRKPYMFFMWYFSVTIVKETEKRWKREDTKKK